MVANYQEFIIPAVSLATSVGVIQNLDGDGLLFEWDILRTRTSEPDTGTIGIYNLSPAISGAIQEAYNAFRDSTGFEVIFSLGWQRIPKKVMVADVWRYVPALRDSTDVMTVFELGDGLRGTQDSQIGYNLSGATVAEFLKFVIVAPVNGGDIGGGGLGLILSPDSAAIIDAASTKANLGAFSSLPVLQSTKQAVDLIMATIGLEWRIHNGEFIPLRAGTINRPGYILRPNRGLVEYTKRDDGGASVVALAIPEVQPGLQVFIQNNLGKNLDAPVYRVDSVRFTGSSNGQSLMYIEAQRSAVL